MFDVSDSKKNWYAVKIDLSRDKLVSAKELIETGRKFNVGLLDSASNFDEIACDGDKVQKAMFAPIDLNVFKEFTLTFFGHVGLEGRSGSISLTKKNHDDTDAPSLPWLVFGTGFDNIMSSECACPAWLIPSRKAKQTPAQMVKDRQPRGPVSQTEQNKENTGDGGAAAANTNTDAMDKFVSNTMGTSKKGAKAKAKQRAATTAKAAKAKPKAKGRGGAREKYPVAFVDEAMFLDDQCNIISYVCVSPKKCFCANGTFYTGEWRIVIIDYVM